MKALIRAILGTDGRMGAKYVNYGALFATYLLIDDYKENEIFLNEENRCMQQKPMLLHCENIGFGQRNHRF